MSPLSLLCIGSLKTSWAQEACAQYLVRLGPRFTVRELSASKLKDGPRQLLDESERLLEVLEDVRGVVWVLDERGDRLTSPALAEALGKLVDRGEPLTLVLGGAYGLTEAVRARADRLVRLSDLVFPHELCRVMLLEQLYRAAEIRRGSGYHH
jgi:23S rRNA (pseudouridine1915-N3)-methyltransferase